MSDLRIMVRPRSCNARMIPVAMCRYMVARLMPKWLRFRQGRDTACFLRYRLPAWAAHFAVPRIPVTSASASSLCTLFIARFAAIACYHRVCYKWFAAPLAFSLDFHILVAFNFAYSVSMRLTISHSVSHCVFYSGSAHSHRVSHRVQDVAMMSAKCPLNCSAVELWYK